MLNVSKKSANRLDIELSGTLDSDAMRSALDHLLELSEGMTKGRILYKISEFEMPTLGAMAVEFSRLPKLLSLTSKFEKCAVLSDAAWIRTAAEIEGAIIPSLRIKGFTMDQLPAAESWLEEATEQSGGDNDEFENLPI